MTTAADLAEAVVARDRGAVAKAITLVESTRPDHRGDADALLDALLPHTGRSARVGISGPPGVGKSTLIEVLGRHVIDGGTSVAVLAVDPSSARSGGSVLGDKSRMADLGRHPDAFIRPSPSGGSLGGVARRTREAILVCEAAGFEVVMIETVGVGQSEVAVADMVDTFVLLVAPGGGDELQGLKRGVMELADVLVITKADGDLEDTARRAEAEYGRALHLLRPKSAEWAPVALRCSSVTGEAVDAVWSAIEDHRVAIAGGEGLDALRRRQDLAWFWSEVRDELIAEIRRDPDLADALDGAAESVSRGDASATVAARRVLEDLVSRG